MKQIFNLCLFLINLLLVVEGLKITSLSLTPGDDKLSPEELVKKLFQQRGRLVKNVNKIKAKVSDLVIKNEKLFKENQEMSEQLNKTRNALINAKLLLNKTKEDIEKNMISSSSDRFEEINQKIKQLFDFQKYYFQIEMFNIEQNDLQNDMGKKLEHLSKIRNNLENTYYDLKNNIFEKVDKIFSKITKIKHSNSNLNTKIKHLINEFNSSIKEEENNTSIDNFFTIKTKTNYRTINNTTHSNLTQNEKKNIENSQIDTSEMHPKNYEKFSKILKKKETLKMFCEKIDNCEECIDNVSCGWNLGNKCIQVNFNENNIGVTFNKDLIHMYSNINTFCINTKIKR